ncbi:MULTISPECIES: TRAP transporter large permease [Dethiosulfovibrio]|uniref:TRAP transporter large permease n=2 Tax=Dethiosulfovibrio TaxID=47054 RepID=A0ABS9ER60_9BACT|nr:MULTISPECIES: TRAP transporter large permease [Dethiosulfovibrio]MCF4115214.1 TRAP transporter large permease [Dethiosulfovibrio russensis]MCF4143677.1 TRAP transporter large permease [Dethiosulfovibrio marinus]MCF4146174.1 TRAP transporter large permease [Dethiosulfovibrio acidaminovorans]
MLITLVGVMTALLLLGFPMMVPLMAGALVTLIFYFPNLDPTMLMQQVIGGIQSMSLIAVPMFIFAADIMTAGEVADRLLHFVVRFIGHKRGGLPIATAGACTLFGAVSGSTQATVVAIGGPMRPMLMDAGYSSSFSTALIINSAEIALLIPPSIYMIVYGVVGGASVGELFIAGVGPGLLIFLFFSLYCWFVSDPHNIATKATWKERMTALKEALLSFTFPLIIFGGIYSGVFSPTEAAAVSVLYAFLLERFVYKSITFKDIPKLALRTGVVTAIVFILIAVGQAFSWTISFARIPNIILPALLGADPTQLRILTVLSIAYFLGCMFVDPVVVIMILTPIFRGPVAASGLDNVLVGTIVTLQAAIGSSTPPFGCNIFTAIPIFRQKYLDVVKGVPPFIIMMVIISALLVMFPQIALFLRDLAISR